MCVRRKLYPLALGRNRFHPTLWLKGSSDIDIHVIKKERRWSNCIKNLVLKIWILRSAGKDISSIVETPNFKLIEYFVNDCIKFLEWMHWIGLVVYVFLFVCYWRTEFRFYAVLPVTDNQKHGINVKFDLVYCIII